MKILKSKPLKSELESMPITLFHQGVIEERDFTNIQYEVRGTVFSISTNTRLEIHKCFELLSDAEIYFNQIIKEFPKSEIMLKSNTVKELKLYI